MYKLKWLPTTEKIKIIVWADKQDDVDTVEFFYNNVSVVKVVDTMNGFKFRYYRIFEKGMKPCYGVTLADGTIFSDFDDLPDFKKAVGMDV